MALMRSFLGSRSKSKLAESDAPDHRHATPDVEAIYDHRFAASEAHRDKIWRVLTRDYFQRWIKPSDAVLDLGAGYCEFINNIQAQEKVALDLNPVTRRRANSNVKVIEQNICQNWNLDSGHMDVVFTSNFFEHLPNKKDLEHCFSEIYRVLRPGGTLIAMGPNIRFCSDVYWDFLDHYLPLSDRSMVEGLELAGFRMDLVVPRFLPYTMARKRPQSPSLVRLYLLLPIAWRILGKQFLLVARKTHV
jgi:SAM-dependent methyltransferase